MLGAIKYNLANLANPAGRDARQTFWYYMLFLVITQVVVSTIAAMPMYIAMFGGAIDAAQSGANEQEMNALMFANMRGHLHTQMWVGAVMGLIMAALFSAAFVRRLHDSGKPGWLLLLVLLPYLASLAFSIVNFDAIMAMTERMMTMTDPAEVMASQSKLYAYSLPSWIAYIVTIVFGVMRSNDGPNRYGDAPVRF